MAASIFESKLVGFSCSAVAPTLPAAGIDVPVHAASALDPCAMYISLPANALFGFTAAQHPIRLTNNLTIRPSANCPTP